MADFTPKDQDARARISESLGETLFVEAGAGTGKTTSLVSRIMNLVETGAAKMDGIAAITFTEAAAAELRERVRDELEKAAADPERDPARRERCRRGVEDLDQSYIGTLHGFASAMLSERPLEAGLPPAFEVMDPITADMDFEEVWREWIEDALDDKLDIPTLPLALALGMTPANMRHIAVSFDDNHDLLECADLRAAPAPEARTISDLAQNAPELERLLQFSKLEDEDPLYRHVQRLLTAIPRLARIEDRTSPLAYGRLNRLKISERRGSQKNWMIDPETGVNACKLIKDALMELDAEARSELEEIRRHALMPILRALKELILEYVAKRKREGRAGFHDLLAWARDMLKNEPQARDYFRDKFSRILIDEVQDTDPIQAEIALFLAAPVGEAAADWKDLRPEVGKLFVVGDRKQSIYRFRRADVRQVTALKEAMGGTTLDLTQNFRSQKPIIEWVNRVFAQWMDKGGDNQADYRSLDYRWEAKAAHPARPGVWSLGGAEDAKKIAAVRAKEVKGIAALITGIVGSEWRVLDREATDEADGGEERYRPARHSDICILMPRRTALRSLEIALDDAGVPYRLDGSSLVFETQEVRDLMNCLRAVDDPANQVALVAALRSPAFAISDVELLDFKNGGGRFDCLDDGGGQPPSRVSDALAELRKLHEARTWTSMPSLIDRFIRERRLMESALGHPRRRESWRRYRFIIESARAFAEAGGESLRRFIEWVDRQIEERARITETPVPEGDEDAVRVMTVHGAKGLEFPIVILTGLNAANRNAPDSTLFDRETGAVQVRTGAKSSGFFLTSGYSELEKLEEEMAKDEEVRLLYVAATRARDHLILSMYRSEKDKTTAAAKIAAIMQTGEDDGGGEEEGGGANQDENPLWRELDADGYIAPSAISGDGEYGTPDFGALFADPSHSMSARAEWAAKRERTIARMGALASVSATGLAKIKKDEPEEEPDEPWRRGRGGAPIGRAVHAVLQTIDLADGAGMRDAARAQAVAEGIPDRADEVARLARTALDSDIARRAVESGRFWREAPMAAPVAAGGAMQGYIDLLFEENGELVVVDYKTDAIDEAHVQDAAERYRLQAGAYALMVSRAAGKRVKEIVFLFLRPKSERSYYNADELAAEAERAAARGFGG